MLSNAKKAWHVALAFVLACALSLPSLAFGLDGKGDTSSAADGTMSVYVEDDAGNTALMKSYTADEFAALAKQVDAGYQYGKGGTINVLAIAKMVELDDLIADAGASQYWTNGANLVFTCTDGVYKKMQPTYEQLHQAGYFYPNRSNTDAASVTDPVEVPVGIALPGWYKTVNTTGELSSDALTGALASLDGTIGGDNKAGDSTKLGIGIADDLANPGTPIDAGWRLTGGIVSVTVKAPAGVSIKPISDCEVSGNDTQYYTGEEITPIKIADAEGNTLSEGVDYTISYTDNVNPGMATYTVTGTGSYIGTLWGTFEITDKILNVQLNGLTVKSYTAADLKSLLKTDTQYYQQSNHGSVVAYAATDYITFADLFANAGVGEYWTDGSNIQYYCYDGLYGKDQPTFADIAKYGYTYPNQSASDMNNTDGATEVPAILAYTYGTAKAGEGLVSDAFTAAAANMKTNALGKVFRGWAADEKGEISAPGWRLATGVVNVNLQTTHASKIFTDVEAGTWYEDAVTFCNFNKFMTGYTGTTEFGVGNTLTRAEFATVLYRIAEPEASKVDPTTVKNNTRFADVEDGQFYTAAANWAVSNEIITGVGGTAFEPNTTVDRQTMCTILSRYLKASSPSHDYLNSMPDADGVAEWATDGVAWALNEGVISGVDIDGTRYIEATTSVTREMAAQVIANSFYNGVF